MTLCYFTNLNYYIKKKQFKTINAKEKNALKNSQEFQNQGYYVQRFKTCKEKQKYLKIINHIQHNTHKMWWRKIMIKLPCRLPICYKVENGLSYFSLQSFSSNIQIRHHSLIGTVCLISSDSSMQANMTMPDSQWYPWTLYLFNTGYDIFVF